MSPSRVRSQPSPRSAHGSWMTHVRPHDALADPLPFVMRDTSLRIERWWYLGRTQFS